MARTVTKRRRAIAAVFAIAAPLFVAATVDANELAYSFRSQSSAVYDGIRGNQGIRTDPATVSGITYAHPVQLLLGVATGDFVAVGTYNGAATTGGPPDCTASFDANWSVYTDGVLGGVYFCNTEQVNAYAAGTNPSFSIQYGVCSLITRWAMYFDGTAWECRSSAYHAGDFVGAGLETAGTSTTDRDIDVKYTNMQTRVTGFTTWDNFGGGVACCSRADPSYTYTYVGVTAFNVYLNPLQ